jgi:acetyl-CoA carboxylase carboxyltransferase component
MINLAPAETILANILARRARFDAPGLTTADIDGMSIGEEADLVALARSGATRLKALALSALPFLAVNVGASAGEWALLRSLVLDLA